jgi:SAM-dependent methyltransferase
MKANLNAPVLGGARNAGAHSKTVNVFVRKLMRLGRFSPSDRMLDVGCGDGSFTVILGKEFNEVYAIDVQDESLNRFRASVKDEKKFIISHTSASALAYPDNYFDTIITIETLEHVLDLPGAASEICRVLKPGGELLITVPNRWFPSENHGMRIGQRTFGRVPFLTYLPWLHRRLALARVFTVCDLDRLFVACGLKRTNVDYLWPTFEHGGNPFQRYLKPLFGLMRIMENSFLRMFGTSIIVRYVKV